MGGPPVRRAVPMATTCCHRMTLSAARTTKWPGGHPRKQAAAWAGRSPALKLVQDLHVRVINAATGELLRELIIHPDRGYQPTGAPPGPKPKTARTH
jgi:hypothetical protein